MFKKESKGAPKGIRYGKWAIMDKNIHMEWGYDYDRASVRCT